MVTVPLHQLEALHVALPRVDGSEWEFPLAPMAEHPDIDDIGWPEPHEIDPSHIVALARRVANLSDQIEALAAADIKLTAMLDKRLPTETEIANVREILGNKAGREWLAKQARFYGIGGLGLLAVIYTTRNYLSQFLGWLSAALK